MNLRKKIDTLKVLRSTLNVWEALAVNRYKRLSAVASSTLPYFVRLREVLEHLYALYPHTRIPLLELREENTVDVVVLTSDRGYVGDFILKTLKALDSFLESKRIHINLFIVGRRGNLSKYKNLKPKLLEGMLSKDIDWEGVNALRMELVGRYVSRTTDGVYIVFQRPFLEPKPYTSTPTPRKKETPPVEKPFLYGAFEEVLKSKPLQAFEKGSYRPAVLRFLPPDIEKKYSPDTIVNFDTNEEEVIKKLVELYLNFFLRHIFLEHFTALNFARYRTVNRIKENIRKKLDTYKRLASKLRQEKITREIQDIVFALIATQQTKYKAYLEKGFTLYVDTSMPSEEIERVMSFLSKRGFPVREVRKSNLIGGFKLISYEFEIDLSVERYLKELEKSLREYIGFL